MSVQDSIPLIVTGITTEAEGIKSFTVAPQNGEILPYQAGQFLTIVLKGTQIEARRSYSLSSNPAVSEPLCFTVKRIDNGLFSRWLHDSIKVGDVLNCTGISGFFTLPDNIETFKTLCFFAAGIGITPIFSIIKTALYSHKYLKIVLVYSNRSAGETLFYKELEALQVQFAGKLKVIHLFSSIPHLLMARLSKEIVPILLKEHITDDLTQTLFYTCGPYAYMRMVIYALEEMHVPQSHIRKENFDITVVSNKPQPPDKTQYTVHLHMDGNNFSFTAQYPDTILKAAQKQGISLPYSCGNGVCGTCAARCTKGKVWHSANEVLTDTELNAGLVLTCVGYPANGDITLEI